MSKKMEEFVARQNVARLRVKIVEASSASARAMLEGLLADEQFKLDGLHGAERKRS